MEEVNIFDFFEGRAALILKGSPSALVLCR